MQIPSPKRQRSDDVAMPVRANAVTQEAFVRTAWSFLSIPNAAGFRRVCKAWNTYGTKTLAQELAAWFLSGLEAKENEGERKKRTDQLSKFGLLAPFDWAKDAALPTALQTDKPLPNWSSRLAAFMKVCCGVCTRPCGGKKDTMTFADNTRYDLSHVCHKCERQVTGPDRRKAFRRIDELTTSGVSMTAIANHWCLHKPDDEDPTNPDPRDVVFMWIDEFDLLHRAAVAAKATESKRVSAYNKQIQAASLHRKEETARRKKAEAKAKRDKATEEDKAKRREVERLRREEKEEEKARLERSIRKMKKKHDDEMQEMQERLEALEAKMGGGVV